MTVTNNGMKSILFKSYLFFYCFKFIFGRFYAGIDQYYTGSVSYSAPIESQLIP